MEIPLKQKIKKIFIDREALTTEVAQRAFVFFDQHEIEIVDGHPYKNHSGLMNAAEYDRSKTELFITNFKGSFFKRCPGAKPGLACCNYFILNLGSQCNMNCSYCYLQSYLNNPILTVYANVDEALNELEAVATQYPERHYRVGTGEIMDSLSIDDFTHYTRKLISFFSKHPNWLLELKSKSAKVDQFLDVPHAKNVLVSWSVNPQTIIDKEEHETASLEQRLKAAEKSIQAGHKITFHIDPMVWYPEWESGYSELVREITNRFSPDQLVYITVGALRFVPEQKTIMRERFGIESLVLQAETFLSSTGKMRYDASLRSKMFELIQNQFKNIDPKYKVSLCMETPETWVSTMSTSPTRLPELKELFTPPQRSSLPASHPSVSL